MQTHSVVPRNRLDYSWINRDEFEADIRNLDLPITSLAVKYNTAPTTLPKICRRLGVPLRSEIGVHSPESRVKLDEERVRELMQAGKSYNAAAVFLGINRYTFTEFCKQHGIIRNFRRSVFYKSCPKCKNLAYCLEHPERLLCELEMLPEEDADIDADSCPSIGAWRIK